MNEYAHLDLGNREDKYRNLLIWISKYKITCKWDEIREHYLTYIKKKKEMITWDCSIKEHEDILT